MLKRRIIPCLLLRDGGLVKTVRFKDPVYVGDPINAVRIFNDKEVDELILLDIGASRKGSGPDFTLLERICSQSFMPMGYGGGVGNLEQIKKLFWLGFEKICLNDLAVRDPSAVAEAVKFCGGQSVVVSIDVKLNADGSRGVYSHLSGKTLNLDPIGFAVRMKELGVGEILLNSVDRDGTMSGCDIELIKKVSEAVDIPVVAVGGVGKLEDIAGVFEHGGASAVAAGSFFVFYGKHRAVLISYPDKKLLERFLK